MAAAAKPKLPSFLLRPRSCSCSCSCSPGRPAPVEMTLAVPTAAIAGRHIRPLSVASAAVPRGARLASATLRTARNAGVDWVEATAEFFRTDTRPIMLFDGVCNLCNGGVRFVRDNDPNRRIRFEALQSEAGRKLLQRSGRAPDDISSVVLVEKDRSYIKSDAVLRIMEYLQVPFPQLAFFFRLMPLFVRDFTYDNVANNRYTIFGRSDSCEL